MGGGKGRRLDAKGVVSSRNMQPRRCGHGSAVSGSLLCSWGQHAHLIQWLCDIGRYLTTLQYGTTLRVGVSERAGQLHNVHTACHSESIKPRAAVRLNAELLARNGQHCCTLIGGA